MPRHLHVGFLSRFSLFSFSTSLDSVCLKIPVLVCVNEPMDTGLHEWFESFFKGTSDYTQFLSYAQTSKSNPNVK